MHRVTIKDIAKIAGVSYATVSRALSGSSEISEDTRARIIAICRQEGYRANSLARSLICNKTNVIGLIVPEITNPIYAEISLGIERYARTLGYNIMLCNSRRDGAYTEELFEFLISHQVDGIILSSSDNRADEWVSKYAQTIPTVLLGSAPAENQLNTVSVDNYAGGTIGVEYLFQLGHEKIAYVGLQPGNLAHELRIQGYLQAASQRGLPIQVLESTPEVPALEHGYALGMQLFKHGARCTAIFAATDITAMGVMQAADECGVDIPGEVSLLGFDNVLYAALPRITLTSIDQPKQLLSKASVDMLLELLERPGNARHMHQLIAPTLVIRDSCRYLPALSPA